MRILVVDDDVDVRSVLRAMLDRTGFEIAEAGDGAEATRILRSLGADLLLCDLFMPNKDGMEVIREFQNEFPGLKVIAMSGGGPDPSVDLLPVALQLGASAVLYKPFTRVMVLAAIRAVFDGCQCGKTAPR